MSGDDTSDIQGAAEADAATPVVPDGPVRADLTAVDPLGIDGPVELAELAAALREELVTTRIERDEHLNTLQRLKAEFDNYRKRMLRDQTAAVERAGTSVIETLLPVLDSFDLALANAPGDDPMREGVEALRGQLLDVLGKAGLERIVPVGEAFDPAVHEAVAHAGGDGALDVVEVLRPGYRLKGHLLRPAMVKVGAGGEATG